MRGKKSLDPEVTLDLRAELSGKPAAPTCTGSNGFGEYKMLNDSSHAVRGMKRHNESGV